MLSPTSPADRIMRTTGWYSSVYQCLAISARSANRRWSCIQRNPHASTASPSSAYDHGSVTVILAIAGPPSGTRSLNIRS